MRVSPLILGLLAITPTAILADGEAEAPRVVLNEVLYNPGSGEGEWVELFNAGLEVDIGGFTITDQDTHAYTFPPLLVPEGGYLLLEVGPGSDRGFEDGGATLHMGLSVPILNDDGDDLLLEGRGRVLDFLRYGEGPASDPPPPQAPWVGSADLVPEGLSLSLIPDGLQGDRPADWRGASPTPGRPNDPVGTFDLLLSEVLPHAPRDGEYVLLTNRGPVAMDAEAWRLDDGEGSWTLPPVRVLSGGQILIARNATALWEDAGLRADACRDGCDLRVETQGSFSLRDSGDVVRLFDSAGRLVDAFHYGDTGEGEGWTAEPAGAPHRGYVARRRTSEGRLVDSNTSADWTWDRTFRLGASRRAPAAFEGLPVAPLLSPGDSRTHLLGLLDGAQERIVLAGFTLTNAAVAEALARALHRGVVVQIGVESAPPGGLGSEGERLLQDLDRAGAQVLLMGSHGEKAWRRYAFHHAKYVVVDDTWLLLGSENFSFNGYPVGAGNRGWGVAVLSPNLARWFLDVNREDWDRNRSDIRAYPGSADRGIVVSPEGGGSSLVPGLTRTNVTALLSPDNAVSEEGLLGVLDGAVARIDVELFYVHWDWRGRSNPILGALLAAAERGVTVRVLLDGQPYNVEGEEDNDEVARRLNRIARERGVPVEARVFPGDSEAVVKLHNKGLIVDERTTWISSMNWNYPGAYENREAGLLVRSPEIAAFFHRAWEEDWAAAERPPFVVVQGPQRAGVGQRVTFRVDLLETDRVIVSAAWDLHGDGRWDGTGQTFTFIPSAPGRHLLRVRVEDSVGVFYSGEAEIDVETQLPFGEGLFLLIAAGSGAAALAWWWKLRTTRESTNKHPRKARRWRRSSRRPNSRSRHRRSRSTPTVP